MMTTNKLLLFFTVACCLLTVSCFTIENSLDAPIHLHVLESNDEYEVVWNISGINGHKK